MSLCFKNICLILIKKIYNTILKINDPLSDKKENTNKIIFLIHLKKNYYLQKLKALQSTALKAQYRLRRTGSTKFGGFRHFYIEFVRLWRTIYFIPILLFPLLFMRLTRT